MAWGTGSVQDDVAALNQLAPAVALFFNHSSQLGRCDAPWLGGEGFEADLELIAFHDLCEFLLQLAGDRGW